MNTGIQYDEDRITLTDQCEVHDGDSGGKITFRRPYNSYAVSLMSKPDRGFDWAYLTKEQVRALIGWLEERIAEPKVVVKRAAAYYKGQGKWTLDVTEARQYTREQANSELVLQYDETLEEV